MNEQRLTDALESLTGVRQAAENMAAAAAAYLDLMTSEPRITPKIGEHYATYNGSLVHVSRRRRPCSCPTCAAERTGAMFRYGPYTMYLPAPEAAPLPADHTEPEEYTVTVIRGGTGIDGMSGCAPGDNYVVRVDGLAIAPAVNTREPVIAVHMIALAAMSLRRHAPVSWL